MAYNKHPALDEPADNQVLWRYMDLEKLVALLEYGTLFFARLSALAKDDPFEGLPARWEAEAFKDAERRAVGVPRLSEGVRIVPASVESLGQLGMPRDMLCVSCWHASSHESAAMWNMYSRQGKGIAIRSTFQRLKTSLLACGEEVYGGNVKYVDFDIHKPQRSNIYEWATCKRLGFAHEMEFRVIAMRLGGNISGTDGVPLRVATSELLESITISPYQSSWVEDIVRRLVQRYSIPVDVRKSSLLSLPEYFLGT
jgi:hypothetical protein